MNVSHGKGTTSVAVVGGKRRVHTTFEDGVEMVEEYDIMTHELKVRKWKFKSVLGKESDWEFEIGDPPQKQSSSGKFEGIHVSTQNPIFLLRDTKSAWEWRIRNLQYPKISVDQDKAEIVLRTTNKKYYKRFKVPSLDRNNLPYAVENITLEHKNSTLIIQYEKPELVLENENKVRTAMLSSKGQKEGDVECNQQ